jgi:NADPH-dependent curcumin reductase CurA
MMAVNERILYARAVHGVPVPEDFTLDVADVPAPAEGQVLVRNIYLALEPYYRNVLKGMAIYGAPLKPGDVMYGETVSQVIDSRAAAHPVGSYVLARGGWQQYAVLDATAARRIEPAEVPLRLALGVLGTPGLTGYVGMVYLAPPRPGQTVVVSAATGPVGSTVGQTARLMGARVVGIAGSRDKCDYAVRVLGFDDCVNYKDGELKVALKRACPDGIDVYFDNVGGDTLAAVLANLALHAQVVLCGMIALYNRDTPPPGPHLGPVMVARATLKGLVVFDYLDRLPELRRVVGRWIKDGKFHYREDITESLQQAPEGFCRLMRGENFGKALVRIAPEQP